MDTSSFIIGSITLIIFVLPIILLHTARRRKEQKQRAEFDLYAQSKGVSLDRFELWNYYSIGIDKDHGRLFYVKQHLDENKEYNVSLNDVESCETKRDLLTQKGNTASDDYVLNGLHLAVQFKDKSKTPLNLEFYNRETANGLSNELELVEKWKKRIIEAITI